MSKHLKAAGAQFLDVGLSLLLWSTIQVSDHPKPRVSMS